MKIELSKNLVEFTPESDNEKTMLEALWRMLVDCMRFNQKLVPVGEYVPGKSDSATFAVEGEWDDESYQRQPRSSEGGFHRFAASNGSSSKSTHSYWRRDQ